MDHGQDWPRGAAYVGRESELRILQSAFDQAVGGRGGVVLVAGEPGIGKSRLVEELAARAAESGAVVVWGRVDEGEGAPPYWPWVQVLDAVTTECERSCVVNVLNATAPVLMAILPGVNDFVSNLVPAPVLDPQSARFRLHQAIVAVLERVGRAQPLVVVLEDLHWFDVASLELTTFVAARIRTTAVLLLLTYRTLDAGSSEVFSDLLGSLARQQPLERITLTGFTEPEVRRFIGQAVDFEPMTTVATAVHARTEGNPFYVGELTRLLKSEGLLIGGSGLESACEAVPTGARDVVQRRVARLPKATREVLMLSAVIGRDFDLSVVAAAADLREADALQRIGPAVAAGLVSDDGTSSGRFRFSHSLVRDSVYASLSVFEKSMRHAQVGAALGRRVFARSHLAELAWHFFQGAAVAGPELGVDYALEAAAEAQASLAYEQAEDILRRALMLIDRMPAAHDRLGRHILLQNRLAMLLTVTRGLSASETATAWRRSRELYSQGGEVREILMPLFGLFIVHSTRADHQTAAAIGEHVLELGMVADDAALILTGHEIVGATSLYRGKLVEAKRHLERSLTLITTFEDSSLLEILPVHPGVMSVELAIVYYLTGESARFQAALREVERFRSRLSHPLSLGGLLTLNLWLRGCLGDIATLAEDAAEASERCVEWGLADLAALSDFWRASALQRRDGHDRTSEISDALLAVEKTGFRLWRTQHLAVLAECCRQVGQIDHALDLVADGLAEARHNDERFWEPELLRMRGELLAAAGRTHTDEAVESVNQAVILARSQGSTVLQHRAEVTLAAIRSRAKQSGGRLDGSTSRPDLSPREREVVSLIGCGLTDKEIAAELVIALATVRTHLERIRNKTGLRRRTELVRLAVELGLSIG
ncbi:MAG: AAA family ATPase [Actinomycetota bacterium]|nr:AAA family ATPase [Actinomycetota bacterium]